MGMCVAKKIGVKIPSDACLNNAFRFAKRMDMAFARNGLIQIISDIANCQEFCEVKKDYDLNDNDAIIMRFSSYHECTEGELYNPLIISDDYDEMLNDSEDIAKPVIMFHKVPTMNKEIKHKASFFTKMLSGFNYKLHKELFNLAIGDNKAVIIEPNGEITTWSCLKTKNWEEHEGALYSDTDYKTYGNSYSYTYDDDYYGYGYPYNYNSNSNSNQTFKYCCQCGKKLTTMVMSNNNYYCSSCYKKKNSKRLCCDICGQYVDSVYIVNDTNCCNNCYKSQKH